MKEIKTVVINIQFMPGYGYYCNYLCNNEPKQFPYSINNIVFFSYNDKGGIIKLTSQQPTHNNDNWLKSFTVEVISSKDTIPQKRQLSSVKKDDKVFFMKDDELSFGSYYNLYVREDVVDLHGPYYEKFIVHQDFEFNRVNVKIQEWWTILSKKVYGKVEFDYTNFIHIWSKFEQKLKPYEDFYGLSSRKKYEERIVLEQQLLEVLETEAKFWQNSSIEAIIAHNAEFYGKTKEEGEE